VCRRARRNSPQYKVGAGRQTVRQQYRYLRELSSPLDEDLSPLIPMSNRAIPHPKIMACDLLHLFQRPEGFHGLWSAPINHSNFDKIQCEIIMLSILINLYFRACLLVFGAVRECSLVKSAKALETKKASKSLT
jgi:hypothetical protein